MSNNFSNEETRKTRNHCKNNKDKKFTDEKVKHKQSVQFKKEKREKPEEEDWEYWQDYYK